MKAFASLCTLALAAAAPESKANVGSYSSFSLGGHTSISYGNNHGHGAPAPAPAPYKPAPAPYKPAPAPYKPAPAPYKPAPAPYKPTLYRPQPAPYKPQPAPYKPAPYHPAPAYSPYQPKPHYGYEKPKHNCTVEDVTEPAEVCTPTLETVCNNVELAIKRIVDGEYCYDVARTVCTETVEEIPNEVCSYSYNKKYEDTTAKTVEVSFKTETNVQMVTVCQPGHQGYGGYGHHGYGGYNQYCKEVAQTTQYNVPVVTPVEPAVRVGYPEPVKTCVNKPISLPRIACEVVTEQKCVAQPEVEEAVESVEKCETKLGAPACQQVELTLPKQRCVELVYGYAEDAHHEPTYAPEPAEPVTYAPSAEEA